MTTAGELRHRIAFDKREEIDDGYGNTQSDFVQQFVTNAAVKTKFGGETVVAARLTGHNTVNITVRRNSRTEQIATDWRARDVREGAVYAIQSIIDPRDDAAWLEILAQTGVAA